MPFDESAAAIVFGSPMFIAAIGLVIILLLEAATKLHQLRFIYGSLVYLTTALWYFIDPVYQPREYQKFTPAEIDQAYLQVVLFLVAFRFLLQLIAPRTPTRILRDFNPREIDRGPIVAALFATWLVLFAIGITRANFDVLNAMFPLKSRLNWGSVMFARPRYGGTTAFLISAASYSYMMTCSGFGMMLVCTRRSTIRAWMLLMIAFTWPMFVLSGSRHTVLAVALPAILMTLLVKRWNMVQRFAFLATCGLVMNVLMLAVIEFRNEGLDQILEQSNSAERLARAKHLGLNMPEEMIHILRYQRSGAMPIEYGWNYVEHVLNVIPRPLWPEKPMPGWRFAALRLGTHRGDLVATLSYGFVGQGVSNFGPLFGPFAPALLLSVFCRLLCGLRNRGNPVARASLMLFCLGLVPNLGRDISLFVLWPAIFGYVAVRVYEWRLRSGRPVATRRRPAGSPPRLEPQPA